MWKQSIVRELAAVLVLKLAALLVIWLAFFYQPEERELSQNDVSQYLLSAPQSASTQQHHLDNQDKGVRDGH